MGICRFNFLRKLKPFEMNEYLQKPTRNLSLHFFWNIFYKLIMLGNGKHLKRQIIYHPSRLKTNDPQASHRILSWKYRKLAYLLRWFTPDNFAPQQFSRPFGFGAQQHIQTCKICISGFDKWVKGSVGWCCY